MPLELVTIPCRADNYAFLVHDAASGQTALFDAPETAPIRAELDARGWTLSHIFLTHHHPDHVEGVADLRAGTEVIGGADDAERLPPLDHALREGDSFTFAGEEVRVFDVSGHTVGHIAFYMPGPGFAFTGDSLMALGCGRVFEGTPEQMHESLGKLAALPDDTLICSGHEYTQSNGRFALTVDPENEALKARMDDIARLREAGEFTVPSTLALEKATNPFLRADDPSLRAQLGMQDAPEAQVFAETRRRKDAF